MAADHRPVVFTPNGVLDLSWRTQSGKTGAEQQPALLTGWRTMPGARRILVMPGGGNTILDCSCGAAMHLYFAGERATLRGLRCDCGEVYEIEIAARFTDALSR